MDGHRQKKNSDERERQTGGAHPLGRGRAVNSEDKEREEEDGGQERERRGRQEEGGRRLGRKFGLKGEERVSEGAASYLYRRALKSPHRFSK
jgi:hypothetical protein